MTKEGLEMRATQTALRKFFKGIEPFEGMGLKAAKRDYNWDLPGMSFDRTPLHNNKTSFEANVELKTRLNEAWNANPDLRREDCRVGCCNLGWDKR